MSSNNSMSKAGESRPLVRREQPPERTDGEDITAFVFPLVCGLLGLLIILCTQSSSYARDIRAYLGLALGATIFSAVLSSTTGSQMYMWSAIICGVSLFALMLYACFRTDARPPRGGSQADSLA